MSSSRYKSVVICLCRVPATMLLRKHPCKAASWSAALAPATPWPFRSHSAAQLWRFLPALARLGRLHNDRVGGRAQHSKASAVSSPCLQVQQIHLGPSRVNDGYGVLRRGCAWWNSHPNGTNIMQAIGLMCNLPVAGPSASSSNTATAAEQQPAFLWRPLLGAVATADGLPQRLAAPLGMRPRLAVPSAAEQFEVGIPDAPQRATRLS